MEEKPTKCSAGHAWLAGIIINLLPYSGSYDLALRDFTLLVAALATTSSVGSMTLLGIAVEPGADHHRYPNVYVKGHGGGLRRTIALAGAFPTTSWRSFLRRFPTQCVEPEPSPHAE
jgi:hypothetical protein